MTRYEFLNSSPCKRFIHPCMTKPHYKGNVANSKLLKDFWLNTLHPGISVEKAYPCSNYDSTFPHQKDRCPIISICLIIYLKKIGINVKTKPEITTRNHTTPPLPSPWLQKPAQPFSPPLLLGASRSLLPVHQRTPLSVPTRWMWNPALEPMLDSIGGQITTQTKFL